MRAETNRYMPKANRAANTKCLCKCHIFFTRKDGPIGTVITAAPGYLERIFHNPIADSANVHIADAARMTRQLWEIVL